ncbi:hypothetical protein PV328_009987 [Microctonus aethiopoides]|uniref:Peptidase S1 domain-containing protein n=1 Tax=Microctonus aethiopoides TaxID=144406 RepID=A0AA39F164_9HYME|nr:hypothetical protein PV328_009987 [Microctonus aethiopoides]
MKKEKKNVVSYKISPKPCRVAGQGGGTILQGTCMFVWECIKSEGTHVGVCVDTFMFGSCCVHKNETKTITTTTITSLADTHQYISSITATAEPSRLSDTTLNAETTSWPIENHPKTPRPSRPSYSSLSNRPKRPHTPSHDFQSSPARLPDDGKNQMVDELTSNQRMRPGELYPQITKPEKASTFIISTPTSAPPSSSSVHYSIVEKDEDNNIIAEMVRDRITAASVNTIRTEKPPITWLATNSPSSGSSIYSGIKTPTYRPGSTFNHHPSTETRPNFVSKPDSQKKPSKLWTTIKPTYFNSQSTSISTESSSSSSSSSSLADTTHWRVTTEPAFITKHKYPNHASTSNHPALSSHHYWSDNSWTTPIDKRPWATNEGDRDVTDDEDRMKKPIEKHPSRPNLDSTFNENAADYGKPHHGSASHYITTADLGSLSKPKPTRKRTPQPPRVVATTSNPSSVYLHSGTPTQLTSTTIQTTTHTTTTTTTTTTETPTTRKNLHGSVSTVSAVVNYSDNGKEIAQCGIPPLFPRPETRIVGGKDAPFGRWPWQVSVRRTSFFGFSSTHRCGGAVLNENWIATAGHCVDDLLTSQIRIRVGDYDFSSVQERLPYVERGIAKKVVHPKYNFFTYEYDLALVRLETSLVFAPHISPICLPGSDDLLVGENATVTGWGRLSEGGTLPSVLQEVSVPIVSNDKCKSMFLRAGRHEFIPDIFLCAGYENGGQDSCQGDSGGPLQVRGKDGRYFLAGIISWGIGCAEANLPGVCTRISKFVPWILKNVN